MSRYTTNENVKGRFVQRRIRRSYVIDGIVEESGTSGLSFFDRPQMLLDLALLPVFSSFFVSLATAVSGRFFSFSGVLEVDSSMYLGL